MKLLNLIIKIIVINMNLDIVLVIQYFMIAIIIINIIYNNYFNQDFLEYQETREKNHRQIRIMNIIIINQALLLRRF